MARLSRLVFACLLALAGASAHAGYAQLAPPPGFAPMPTASPARWGYAKAANEAWVNQTVRVNASLNVGGQAIKVPAAMRLAANAPRFAAAAIFASPHLRVALGIATLLSAADVFFDLSKNQWMKKTESSVSVYKYLNGNDGIYYDSSMDAANALAAKLNNVYIGRYKTISVTSCSPMSSGHAKCYFYGAPISQYSTEFSTDYLMTRVGPSQSTSGGEPIPLTNEEDFIKEVINPANNPGWPGVPADWPMPSSVPNELPPGIVLPVDDPIINPSPGPNPQPQPYFVPQGDPVPNPNYDPNAAPSPQNQPYIIPGVRIVPSPTPDNPWRVDVQPVNRPTADPKPLTPDQLNPQPDPNADPNTQPDPGAEDKPKPEEQQSLCEKHPEILACQKLDNVEPTELAKQDININISPVAGWGSDSAACPAPRAVVVAGKSVEISWQPVCDFATGLRPLVIALAWLSAVSMVIVVARRN